MRISSTNIAFTITFIATQNPPLADAVSIINSEVWWSSCPDSQYHDIEVALNIIYRRLLGVEAKTASVAVWHEWASRPSQLV